MRRSCNHPFLFQVTNAKGMRRVPRLYFLTLADEYYLITKAQKRHSKAETTDNLLG
jgi:hypothetical protein